MPAEADVPVLPEVAPEDVPAFAPVEGDGVPGFVCEVLSLAAPPDVPAVVPLAVPDMVPEVVLQGPLCVIPVPFEVLDGWEPVPVVGVLADVEPGTLWFVVLPGGVAVLPCEVAVLPDGEDGEAV